MIQIEKADLEIALGGHLRQVVDLTGHIHGILQPWVRLAAHNKILGVALWEVVYPFFKYCSPDIEGAKQRYIIAIQLRELRPAQVNRILRRSYIQRAVLALLGRFLDPMLSKDDPKYRKEIAWGHMQEAIKMKLLTKREAEEALASYCRRLKFPR